MAASKQTDIHMSLAMQWGSLRLTPTSMIFTLFFPPIHVADREVQRILLELLNQMDGFDQSVNVKVCTCLVCAS